MLEAASSSNLTHVASADEALVVVEALTVVTSSTHRMVITTQESHTPIKEAAAEEAKGEDLTSRKDKKL